MEVASFKPFWWLIVLLPMLVALRLSLVDRPKRLKYASIALRGAAIVLLVLALCRPFIGFGSDAVHVAFLLDVSESVDLRSTREAVDTIQGCIDQLHASDSWSLFLVANGVMYFERTEDAARDLDTWLQTAPDDDFRSASKLADALSTARLCFPADKARRIVLFSDGRPTHADMTDVLALLGKERIDLRMHELSGLQAAEACVRSIEPSTTKAFAGEVVRMTVKVRANQPMPAVLTILNRAVVVTRKELQLDSDGDNVVHLDIPMTTSGATHWTAELNAERDHFLINNKATSTVSVGGKPRILILHGTPREMRPFCKAMDEQGFETDLRDTHGLPGDLVSLLAFDAVILADIAATDLSPRQMALLKRYVVDFGGGLAMFGSDNSFGLGGYHNTPVEEVLPLISRYEKAKQQPSVAMVLVIDKSGSMQGMPIELARQAAKATVDLLGTQDQIGVVGFDGQAFVVSPMRRTAEADAVKSAIDTLASGGGTAMYPGIDAAFQMLQGVVTQIKHVIVLSDGQSQPADHQALVSDMAAAGITVSTVALGHADRALLASLAEIGKGRYYETADPANIPQIFTKETMETSRSAVKEDVFNLVRTSDHPLFAGLGSADLPVVFGYVMATAKPATQLLLVAHSGDPVMAVSRYGLGSTLAYTSDVTAKWGSQWLAWNQFGRFWSQALRGILRRESTDGLHLRQSRDDDRWTIDITRLDPSGEPVKGVEFKGQTVDETDTVNSVSVEEIGLGRYRAVVPVGDSETLSLRLDDPHDDKMAILHFNKPYPAEYDLAGQIAPALQGLSRLDGNAVREDIIPTKICKPVSHLCHLLALTAMLAGLLLRRI
ncbi:VWA domain-containing protein [Anaerobaca lacustris]|uniref:VWA domain-containing protein n=1 Tax=Anaerobaca lacustris TaxID=3044600 RepID=A0AAW6U405_9BACT|nr:VWA domain-containing protein [Sedimentisphaerales bacterium M17dextr]